MAVPKRKISKQRKHTRAANWKVAAVTLVECPQCHTLKVPHQVCEECGYYDGKVVVEKKEEK
ncbi:MAG: 50S ribosomal protein L32 [Clostridia bacterium]|nr:50S ribosomal protein L32 [Clostridia bacterium]